MAYRQLLFGFICAILLASMQQAATKPYRVRAVAVALPHPEYVPSRWFQEFDQIELDGRIPSSQRDRGAVLMMRTFAGLSRPAEYAEARGILSAIAMHYRKVASSMCRLPAAAEVEDMRRGYVAYYCGMAQLCEECAALPLVDAPKSLYRPLTQEEMALLVKRKHLLDDLLNTCRCTEQAIRKAHGLSFPKNANCD